MILGCSAFGSHDSRFSLPPRPHLNQDAGSSRREGGGGRKDGPRLLGSLCLGLVPAKPVRDAMHMRVDADAGVDPDRLEEQLGGEVGCEMSR